MRGSVGSVFMNDSVGDAVAGKEEHCGVTVQHFVFYLPSRVSVLVYDSSCLIRSSSWLSAICPQAQRLHFRDSFI